MSTATVERAPEQIAFVGFAHRPLPTYRVNLMRAAYLFMAVGLAFVKWPLFIQSGGVAALPAFEGVVAALLTAMSLLALLGVRYPIRLLPVLVFEVLWKVIWLVSVGVPHLLAGTLDGQLSSIFANVSLLVVIAALTPWAFAWKQYVRAAGDAWR
jgi:hypothetical protein